MYLVTDSEKNEYALKLHRLGRTSFRNVKEKRDYLGNRLAFSWLYLSRLSALRELAYMRLLSENGFPVPTPIGNNRHAVVMSVVNGILLQNVMELSDPGSLYGKIISLMVKLAESGLIHSDYNEFNIMIDDDSNPVLIDFPQMVSIDHVNAGMYFDRDLKCIKTYFLKKFKFESGDPDPKLSEISRNSLFLDVKSHASGSQRLSRKKLAELAEVCPPLVPSEDSSEQDAVDYEYSEDDVAAARINPLEDIFSKLALEDSKQSGDPRDSSCIRKNFKKHISKKYSRPKKTKSNIIKNPNSRYANDQVKNLSCDVWG